MKNLFCAGAALAALIAVPASAQVDPQQGPRNAGPLTRASVQAMVQARFAMVDANHDGFVTRDEAEARTAFNRDRMRERFDARRGERDERRGDMEARRGERDERHGDMQARMGDRPGNRFDRLDANHDGSISRAEFDGAFAARAEHRREGGPGMERGPMMRRHAMRDGGPRERGMNRGGGMGGFGANMLERLDADHDGRVSLAEASAGALAMFDRADANRDGTVTPDERRAARERFREARQDRRRG